MDPSANGGDSVEKYCVVPENMFCQKVLFVIVLFVAVIVSMEIEWRHYFWRNLCISRFKNNA